MLASSMHRVYELGLVMRVISWFTNILIITKKPRRVNEEELSRHYQVEDTNCYVTSLLTIQRKIITHCNSIYFSSIEVRPACVLASCSNIDVEDSHGEVQQGVCRENWSSYE